MAIGESKSLDCTYCGKTCSSRYNLKKHERDIHLNKGTKFSCKFCQRNYSSLNSLQVHCSVTHPTGNKRKHNHSPKKLRRESNESSQLHIKEEQMETSNTTDVKKLKVDIKLNPTYDSTEHSLQNNLISQSFNFHSSYLPQTSRDEDQLDCKPLSLVNNALQEHDTSLHINVKPSFSTQSSPVINNADSANNHLHFAEKSILSGITPPSPAQIQPVHSLATNTVNPVISTIYQSQIQNHISHAHVPKSASPVDMPQSSPKNYSTHPNLTSQVIPALASPFFDPRTSYPSPYLPHHSVLPAQSLSTAYGFPSLLNSSYPFSPQPLSSHNSTRFVALNDHEENSILSHANMHL